MTTTLAGPVLDPEVEELNAWFYAGPVEGEAPDELEPPEPSGQSLQERFEAFHAANPWVYVRLRNMALALVERGHRRIGVKMLMEALRFHTMLRTTGSEWKLNNSFTSRYARMLIENEPALASVIETRVLHV